MLESVSQMKKLYDHDVYIDMQILINQPASQQAGRHEPLNMFPRRHTMKSLWVGQVVN